MRIRTFKGDFKAGGIAHVPKQDKPLGGGPMQCAPILQYHDIVKQRVTDMYCRDRAFMEQIKPRFTPSGPPILQLLKRKPLERTVFMQGLRYPPIHVEVTPLSVIGRIL